MELINVVSEKLKELLTIKLHEKGIVYYSKLEEKKLETAEKLQKMNNDAAMARERVKARSAKANKVVGEK